MKQVKSFLTILTVALLSLQSAEAKVGPSFVVHHASINVATGLISINANAPVLSTYTFDVSGLSFANQQAANDYFKHYTKHEYIAISVNLQTKVATMTLNYALIADMQLSVAKWNHVLQMANEHQ
ncbi:MAG: hypothetical protein KDD27_27980 [Saprospiraceae bacterium]|nr:hypothetical protein [Saprospiraceae bacterium]